MLFELDFCSNLNILKKKGIDSDLLSHPEARSPWSEFKKGVLSGVSEMYSVTHPTFKVFTIPWDPNNPEKLHGDSGSNVSAGSFFSRSFWSFRNLQVAIIVAARHAEFTHIADTCWTANRAVGCYYLMAIDWGILPGFWAEMELSQQKKIKEYRHVMHHLQRYHQIYYKYYSNTHPSSGSKNLDLRFRPML